MAITTRNAQNPTYEAFLGMNVHLAVTTGSPVTGAIEPTDATYQRVKLTLTPLPPGLDAADEFVWLHNPRRIVFPRAREPWGTIDHLVFASGPNTGSDTTAYGEVPINLPLGGVMDREDQITIPAGGLKIKVVFEAGAQRVKLADKSALVTLGVYHSFFRDLGDALDADYAMAPTVQGGAAAAPPPDPQGDGVPVGALTLGGKYLTLGGKYLVLS